jgi:hypothetical protein
MGWLGWILVVLIVVLPLGLLCFSAVSTFRPPLRFGGRVSPLSTFFRRTLHNHVQAYQNRKNVRQIQIQLSFCDCRRFCLDECLTPGCDSYRAVLTSWAWTVAQISIESSPKSRCIPRTGC